MEFPLISFVIVPLLMLLGLWLARTINQIRGVMVAGSSILLVLAVALTYCYLSARSAGVQDEMLFTSDMPCCCFPRLSSLPVRLLAGR